MKGVIIMSIHDNDNDPTIELTKGLQSLVRRGKGEKSGPNNEMEPNWFVENLKKVLRELPGYKYPDRADCRAVIDGAETLGQMVDMMYYGWSLHNDPAIIIQLMEDTIEKHGCVVQ